jgi:hypothetical protein
MEWMTAAWENRARQPQYRLSDDGTPERIESNEQQAYPVNLVELVQVLHMSLDEVFRENETPTVGGKIQNIVLDQAGVHEVASFISKDDGQAWENMRAEKLRRLSDEDRA